MLWCRRYSAISPRLKSLHGLKSQVQFRSIQIRNPGGMDKEAVIFMFRCSIQTIPLHIENYLRTSLCILVIFKHLSIFLPRNQ